MSEKNHIGKDVVYDSKDTLIASMTDETKSTNIFAASDEVLKDEDTVLSVMKKTLYCPEAIYIAAHPDLHASREFSLCALDAVEIDYRAAGVYKALPFAHKCDQYVFRSAFFKTTETLKYAPPEIYQNEELMAELIDAHPNIFQRRMGGFEHLFDEKSFVKLLSKSGHFDHDMFEQVSERLKADRDTVAAMVEALPFALRLVDPEFKCDKEIVLSAVRQDGSALEHASYRLREDPEVVLVALQAEQNGHIARHSIGAELQKYIGENGPEQAIKALLLERKLQRDLQPKSRSQQLLDDACSQSAQPKQNKSPRLKL
jgi:hypothetical protein